MSSERIPQIKGFNEKALAVALAPKWQQAAAEASKQLAKTLERIEAPRIVIRRMPGISASLRKQIAELFEAVGPQLEAQWARSLPDNWRGLSAREVDPILTLMDELGTSLVWVPTADSLHRLLAGRGDRRRRLIRHEAALLEDLDVALRKRLQPELHEYRRALRGALNAHRDGHVEAAQTLTAAALTAMAEAYLMERGERFSHLVKRDDRDPMTASIQGFRRAVVYKRVAVAVNGFAHGRPPALFNRNASAHTVSPRQLTRANSLAGLMLGVSLLRELERELREAQA